MPIGIPENEIMKLGLHYAGFNNQRQQRVDMSTNLQHFWASYGALPISCAQIFEDVQADDIGVSKIVKPNAIYLLMTLCWLNTYVTENHLAGQFNISKNTVRKWCWAYSKSIQAQKQKKVSTLRNCYAIFIVLFTTHMLLIFPLFF
jgi:hypothetical protein